MDIKNLSLADLQAARTEKAEALQALFALDKPSTEQVSEAQALAADLREIDAAVAEQAAAEPVDPFADLREEFAVDPEAETPDDEEEEPEAAAADAIPAAEDAPVEAAEAAETPAAEAPKAAAKTTKAAAGRVQRLAAKTARPQEPETPVKNDAITITASANVGGFAMGQDLTGMDQVAAAIIAQTKGFPKFNPATATRNDDGSSDLRKTEVASFNLQFPSDLTVDRGSDDFAVIEHARNEARLESEQGKGSLVAAGGWCAPSETIYDLCEGETLDGIVSVPEINVARGGINYTSGPDFASLYTDTGFVQTEAQAIAGEEKDCYEVECPPFQEVRLEAVGLCITVPILTNSAYPELVRRVTSGSIVAHQHRVNARVIGKMVTLSGAARVITGLGSTVSDTLEALELLADERRQHYRLGIGSTLEVVLPFWVKGAMRSDLARRNGVGERAINDAAIQAHFAARNLNVQWAYDWQPLDETAEVYPATYNALVYPAGTFVKGTTDVINLSAVYDKASLQVNTYTGLFMEQGLLVAKTCYGSDLVTLPVCNAGRTGAQDLTCV